jgi:RNA polymerase sigma-70 factor (sigma-E family)
MKNIRIRPPDTLHPPVEPVAPGPLLTDLRDLDREAAVTRLFYQRYTSLLRLAVLLGADDAENIVAEAFCQLHHRWNRLRTPDAALPYLRSVVCNLTRMRLRHLQVARRHEDQLPGSQQSTEHSAEHTALLHDDQRALVDALQQLSTRQREAVVLRYWLGLNENDIAEAMGISPGAVKSHTSRAMTSLTKIMKDHR